MHIFSEDDISKATTVGLLAELRSRESELELEHNKYARRTLELRICELQRWLAIHNARTTNALEGMREERLREIEQQIDTLELGDGAVSLLRELTTELRRVQRELIMLFPRYELDIESTTPSAGPDCEES